MDRTWFEQKVRDLGDTLRRLPRAAAKRPMATMKADGTPTEPTKQQSHPEYSGWCVVVMVPGEKPPVGTYTAPEPYGIDATSEPTPKATVRRLESDRGESD